MMKRLLIWTFALLLASGVIAGSGFAQGIRTESTNAVAENRYRECLDLAERAPDKAIDNALAWQAADGGVPARHCEAIALATAGEFGEAAVRLEGLVEDMRIGRDMPIVGGKRVTADPVMVADVYGQAANAWLLAGEVWRAVDAIDAALSVVPKETAQEMVLLVDRARIAAADDDYKRAYSDLVRVRVYDPGRRDILILMATAARALGRYEEAQVALDGYRATFPDDLSGVLEQAHIHDAQGDVDEARRLYLQIADEDAEGYLGQIARDNLERLALGSETKLDSDKG